MSRIQTLVYAAFMVVMGVSVGSVFADDPNPEPEYKTSTGRELNGPGTHHSEYGSSPYDTSNLRFDSAQALEKGLQEIEKPNPSNKRKKGAGRPVPGVDDKSSTRPGE